MSVSAAGVSAAGVSAAGVSAAGVSSAGVSAAGVSAAGVSAAGVSAAGVSSAGVSAAGVSAAGVSSAGVSSAGVSAAGVSSAGDTEAGTQSTSNERPRQDDDASEQDDASSIRSCTDNVVFCIVPASFITGGEPMNDYALRFPKIETDEQFVRYCVDFNKLSDVHMQHHKTLIDYYKWLEHLEYMLTREDEYTYRSMKVVGHNARAEAMHGLLFYLRERITTYNDERHARQPALEEEN